MTILFILKFFAFVFGSMIGSFLNVVIYRLPLKKSVVHPRSSCPNCGFMIPWYLNIPILSYLLLKGKCLKCKFSIPKSYFFMEVFMGLSAMALAPKGIDSNSLMSFFTFFGIFSIFTAHFFIDIKHQILPDILNLYLLAIIAVFSVLNYPISHWLIGGLIGFLGPFLVTYLFYKVRGVVGLGGGDIKLYGILGILLGPLGIMNLIFFSCFIGAVIGSILIGLKKLDRNKPFAFGPYIILTAVLQIYFPYYFNQVNFLVIK